MEEWENEKGWTLTRDHIDWDTQGVLNERLRRHLTKVGAHSNAVGLLQKPEILKTNVERVTLMMIIIVGIIERVAIMANRKWNVPAFLYVDHILLSCSIELWFSHLVSKIQKNYFPGIYNVIWPSSWPFEPDLFCFEIMNDSHRSGLH